LWETGLYSNIKVAHKPKYWSLILILNDPKCDKQ